MKNAFDKTHAASFLEIMLRFFCLQNHLCKTICDADLRHLVMLRKTLSQCGSTAPNFTSSPRGSEFEYPAFTVCFYQEPSA